VNAIAVVADADKANRLVPIRAFCARNRRSRRPQQQLAQNFFHGKNSPAIASIFCQNRTHIALAANVSAQLNQNAISKKPIFHRCFSIDASFAVAVMQCVSLAIAQRSVNALPTATHDATSSAST
jgi:hypothetical protein